MRKPHGFGYITHPDKALEEFDTVTCNHCNCIYAVKPKENPSDIGGFCMRCMELICGPCADRGNCIPFEKQIEEEEARNRFLKSAGLL